jgi:divalent metal cation (Fe/Co/Zn/Cd) transporter
MRALILVAGAALGLSACATTGSPTVAAQRGVYNAESDFAAALPVAVAYENLPACSATQKFPCSDPSAVVKITAAAKAARASLSTAEAAVRSNSNSSALTTAALQAQGDVAAFVALVGAFAK